MKLVYACAVFALVGMGAEVFFTAVSDWWSARRDFMNASNKCLRGYASILYMPLYGIIPAIMSVVPASFFDVPWVGRGLCYLVAVYMLEAAYNYALRAIIGKHPSDDAYRASRFSAAGGLVRLDFIPFWFAASLLVFEPICLRLIA